MKMEMVFSLSQNCVRWLAHSALNCDCVILSAADSSRLPPPLEWGSFTRDLTEQPLEPDIQ